MPQNITKKKGLSTKPGFGAGSSSLAMLDRLIIIRDSVNMDVFMLGATPESLWEGAAAPILSTKDNVEAADIFATAMKNNFSVGRIIMDQILAGQF